MDGSNSCGTMNSTLSLWDKCFVRLRNNNCYLNTLRIVFGRNGPSVLMSSFRCLLSHFVHQTTADKSKIREENRIRFGSVVFIAVVIKYFSGSFRISRPTHKRSPFDLFIVKTSFHLHKPKLIFGLTKFKVPIIQYSILAVKRKIKSFFLC